MKLLQYILFCLTVLFSISCTKGMEDIHDVPEGMVEVCIEVPDIYDGVLPDEMTKADSEFLAGKLTEKLPVGSTLWLSYSKKTGEDYEDPVVKPYIVKNDNDYIGLYPCGTDEYTDGNEEWLKINTEVEDSPLYLEQKSTYKFKALYPAHDIRKSDLQLKLHNGIWACTNDPRYTQTAATNVTLTPSGASKITYVELQPMINQTARIHFEIAKGENVHTLEMMHNGIEISGVQDKETLYDLDWTLDDYIEVIQLESIDDGKHWYKLQEFEVRDDKIIGDAYILPLDVRRTYIFILINMAVNGIPTQYVLTLNGIILEHSRSYNFDLRAGMDGNLTVVNWQNTSLTIQPK